MLLALSIFFLFSIYGVVSVYLPIILTSMGYTATQVGLLLGIFEGAGVVLPLVMSLRREQGRGYGLPLLLMGALMAMVPFPLVRLEGFYLTALFLVCYSLGYKGAVPLSDSLINKVLGDRRDDYGKVRVAGSVGYVVMALLLQWLLPAGTARQYLGWMIATALLFTLSLLFIPGIFSRDAIPTVPTGGGGVPQEKAQGKAPAGVPAGEGLGKSLAQFPPVFWMGLLLVFLGFLGLTPATKLFALYMTDFIHSEATGALSALAAISEIPFMFFSSRFLRHYGSLRLLVFCTAMVTVRLMLYLLLPNMAGAVLGQLMNSVTYGLYHPAAVVFVAQYAPKGRLIMSQSLYSIFAVGVASVLGSSLSGWMIDSFGYPVLFVTLAMFPLGGVILYFFVRKRI